MIAQWASQPGATQGDVSFIVQGELDAFSSGHIEEALREVAERREVSRVNVNMAAVDFIDARAIRALLKAKAASRASIVVVEVSRRVSRLLDLTETGDYLCSDHRPAATMACTAIEQLRGTVA